MIDIKVPTVGESITEVSLIKWLKKDGEYVERDAVIAELESEKATFEVNAEKAGVLKTVGKEGDNLKIGDLLAQIDETAAKPEGAPAAPSAPPPPKESTPQPQAPAAQKAAPAPPAGDMKASPVAAAMIADKGVDPKSVAASGVHGKILKNDVLDALKNPGRAPGKEMFSRELKKEKMSNLRKTVSRRLVEAKKTWPLHRKRGC